MQVFSTQINMEAEIKWEIGTGKNRRVMQRNLLEKFIWRSQVIADCRLAGCFSDLGLWRSLITMIHDLGHHRFCWYCFLLHVWNVMWHMLLYRQVEKNVSIWRSIHLILNKIIFQLYTIGAHEQMTWWLLETFIWMAIGWLSGYLLCRNGMPF